MSYFKMREGSETHPYKQGTKFDRDTIPLGDRTDTQVHAVEWQKADKWVARDSYVRKTGDDYTFYGRVVGRFVKLNGKSIRVVVENTDGGLKIFDPERLEVWVPREFMEGSKND